SRTGRTFISISPVNRHDRRKWPGDCVHETRQAQAHLSEWTAAWPTVTHMRNFENVRRTGDVINESIRYFSQQYIDMPITQA
ncbi:hypothetical protein INQ71_26230, partial [Escherichia coli]|uniref:hypothetical protein n=1 Tax=Escherichia coli TaxID=562 RepID=UPI001E345889